MAGWLARLSGAQPVDDSNFLGLGASAQWRREMLRERDREISKRVILGQVVAVEVRVIEQTHAVAAYAAANMSRAGEVAAAVVPEERHRSDSVTETATMLVNQAMAKLANL